MIKVKLVLLTFAFLLYTMCICLCAVKALSFSNYPDTGLFIMGMMATFLLATFWGVMFWSFLKIATRLTGRMYGEEKREVKEIIYDMTKHNGTKEEEKEK